MTTFYFGIIGFEFLSGEPILLFIAHYVDLFSSFRYAFSLNLLRDRSSAYPVETGWVVFNLLASFIVLGFSLFALYPSIVKGMTLNESIKWEELEESLKIEGVEMESLVLECNQKNLNITNDILQEAAKSNEKVIIKSTRQLRNIYGTGGIYENIKKHLL
jgi:hypothetical protein